MNQKIMSYIPKSKNEAVRDAYKDEDGYWICLNEGWEASRTDSGCRTIHKDTIKDLRYQIAGIQRVTTEDPEPEKVGGITAAEPDPVYNPAEMARPEEYQAIHDSMVESFYEYCTGEKIPDNWKEILQEKKRLKATKPTKPTEAVEIILEDITQDPEYFDTPIPPRHDPEPQPPAPKSGSGKGAAETVAFGLCLGLACMVYGAKELAELLILAIQALWISTVPLARKAGKAAYRSWLEFYPVARQTAGRTARIASRQIALAVWYVWIVIA